MRATIARGLKCELDALANKDFCYLLAPLGVPAWLHRRVDEIDQMPDVLVLPAARP